MDENNVNNNEAQNPNNGNGEQIVVNEGGIVRKILKGVGIVLTVAATFVTGFLFGKKSGSDDEDDSSEQTEGPKED